MWSGRDTPLSRLGDIIYNIPAALMTPIVRLPLMAISLF
jgi:hypothetical protein